MADVATTQQPIDMGPEHRHGLGWGIDDAGQKLDHHPDDDLPRDKPEKAAEKGH